MTKSIGAAIVALALISGGIIPIVSAVAAPLRATVQRVSSALTKPDARRGIRYYPRYAYRAFAQPYYLDRPYYYVPVL
jgi:hypothetical protein